MKRMTALFLMALMLLCAFGSAAQATNISKDSTIVQDPLNYMPKSMTFDSIETRNAGQQYRKYRGGADSYELMNGYVEALCATGNFQLKDSYYKVRESTFFSFALTYTGNGRVSDEKPPMNFKDDVYGDVSIYGVIERSSCKGYVYIVKGLEFDDLGLRSTGENVSVAMSGGSLNAELYRLDDGSYQTDDGRFHVGVGQAQVYRDGTAYTVPATLQRNMADNREELRIYNFYRNDSILFTAPYNSLLTGDVFDTRSIGVNERSGRYDGYTDSMEDFLGWVFSNKIVGVCHDGDYLFCYVDGGNGFDAVSVRVMYWDANLGEAVIYICAQFDTAPYEYEAMAAVKMEDAVRTSDAGSSSSGKDGKTTCRACNGSGRCSTCGGTGTVRRLLAGTTEWVSQTCTSCYTAGSGKCSFCGGTGEK